MTVHGGSTRVMGAHLAGDPHRPTPLQPWPAISLQQGTAEQQRPTWRVTSTMGVSWKASEPISLRGTCTDSGWGWEGWVGCEGGRSRAAAAAATAGVRALLQRGLQRKPPKHVGMAARARTWPVMATRGTESRRASARPVTRLVAPAGSEHRRQDDHEAGCWMNILGHTERWRCGGEHRDVGIPWHPVAPIMQGRAGHSGCSRCFYVPNVRSPRRGTQQRTCAASSITQQPTHRGRRWRCTRPRGPSPWRSPQRQRSRPAAVGGHARQQSQQREVR